jgi:hypothetical protein
MREIGVDNLSIKTFACDRIPSYAQNPWNNIIEGACTTYLPKNIIQGCIKYSPKKFSIFFFLKENKESDEIFENISFVKLKSS